MLRWISEIASPRSYAPEHEGNSRRTSCCDHDSLMMTDLIMAEVEDKIVQFEVEKEKSRSKQHLNSKMPDYSWLVSADVKPKKYLTIQEKFRLEKSCERLRAEEWAQVLDTFRRRSKNVETRDQILGEFAAAAHEIISARPRNVSVNDVLRKYTRTASSINAVSYSTSNDSNGGHVQVGDSYTPPDSARTVAGVWFGMDHIV